MATCPLLVRLAMNQFGSVATPKLKPNSDFSKEINGTKDQRHDSHAPEEKAIAPPIETAFSIAKSVSPAMNKVIINTG